MDLLTRFLAVNLATKNLKLSKKDTDGRVNSSINEKEIRASIKTAASCNEQFTDQLGLSITDPADRDWVDFTVEGKGVFVPVNIKVTTMRGSQDNLSCKLGMYYALTGIRPDFRNRAFPGEVIRSVWRPAWPLRAAIPTRTITFL